MSAFTLTYLIAALLCVWALLRCMGNERDRATRDMEEKIRAEDREKAEKDVLGAIAAANSLNPKSAQTNSRRAA